MHGVRSCCPACGAALESFAAAPPSDVRLAARPLYPLARCDGCGTLSLPPEERAGESPALYRRGSYAPARPWTGAILEPLRRLAERDRLRALRTLPPGARVLEVGAGDGRFLRALGRRGFHARGLDAFAAGADVDEVPLEEAELPRRGFDAVVFWHALEHVDDPAGALERAGQTLVPGGLLVVAVPNAGSLQARLGGKRWFQRDLPRHRVLFTERGLRTLLRRCGFDVAGVRHLGVDQNLLAMWQTLLNRLTREQDVAFRALKGSLPHGSAGAATVDLAVSAVAGALLLAPAVALELGAGLARRGGSLVVEARRSGP